MSSSEPVTISIDAEPVPKARPRMSRFGKVYTEGKTLAFENLVRWTAKIAMAQRRPILGPVRAELLFELPIPASWSAKQKSMALVGEILPSVKPDIDNFCKAVLDGLNEIVFGDDGQIVDVRARKIYSQRPQIIVTVFPMTVPPPPLPARRKLDPEIERKLFGPAPFASGFPERRK